MIYLDNAATGWPKPDCVVNAVVEALTENGGNPGRGGHSLARAASRLIYRAREGLARLFNAEDSAQIVFTASATAGINLLLSGMARPASRVVVSSAEHNAVARPLRRLQQERHIQIVKIRCDRYGRLDVNNLKEHLADGADLVVVGHASNVTGAIYPLADIAELCKWYEVPLVVDAAQTVGRTPIDVTELDLAGLAASGHKGLFGPQGCGFVYIKNGGEIPAMICGGTGSASESDHQPEFMPDKFESGTANLPGIAGLAAGVNFIREIGLEEIHRHEMFLAEKLVEGLAAIPGVTVYGPPDMDERSSVVSFNVDGCDCGEVEGLLDQRHRIICRAGMHCAPWAHSVLGTALRGTVRLSPGWQTTEEEVEQTLAAVAEIATKRS
ncbi:MAG: aminotransferase class V-fold PLP-dependent enzyme [Negativicutes bacterium]|nr:aminotransferase class V-fold PLP-dependent enzyme [Negativicutes bacterium]